MSAPNIIDLLKAELADAKTAHEHCSFHDDYQRMRACRGECQREIDRLNVAIAKADKP